MNNFKSTIGRTCNNAGYKIVKNWPQVGTGLGIIGFYIAGIWAVKNTKKALKKIEADSEEKYNDPEAYTPIDAVKSAWSYYVGPLGLSILSTICDVSATNESLKRTASMALLYSLSETQLREHMAKTEEIVGKKKAKEIEQAVADEDAKRIPANTPVRTTTYIGTGKFPWWDPLSKSAVYTNKTTMDDVVNRLNHRMINGMEPYISYDDFCDEAGFDRLEGGLGRLIGWDTSRLIEIDEFVSDCREDPATGELQRVLKFTCGHGPEQRYDSLH